MKMMMMMMMMMMIKRTISLSRIKGPELVLCRQTSLAMKRSEQ